MKPLFKFVPPFKQGCTFEEFMMARGKPKPKPGKKSLEVSRPAPVKKGPKKK